MKTIDDLKKKALEIISKHHSEYEKILSEQEISYYSWPGIFSSTSGPHGCAGGQQITSFQIHGFMCEFGDGVLFCCGKTRYVKKFIPLMGWEENGRKRMSFHER